jgi:hypothetical protein
MAETTDFLRGRKRLILAVLMISTAVAVVCAKVNTRGNLLVAGAATHVIVDDPGPSIVDRRAQPDDVIALQQRAELYARLLVSDPVLAGVARRAGIAPGQLSGVARSPGVPYTFTQPDSEVRAAQIIGSRAPYQLEMQASIHEPVLSIYSQAPSVGEAQRLADAAVLGLQDYLRALARGQAFPVGSLPTLRQLGPARGGVIAGHASVVIAALTWITAFGLTCALLLGVAYLRARRRRPAVGGPARAAATTEREGLDDWPHTTRVLPWMVAGFIAMLWLTPFDKIQLAISTPIDMKLDRLVLPFVFVVWVIAFAAGGRLSPRLRITPIHVALAAFLACAFLSVVLDARSLNRTLELDLALKKLPLLISYMSLFVIVASAVRRTEVRAFMTYSLVLAVICGVGVIWEYRFKQNLFSIWTERLLPPGFRYDSSASTVASVDSLGRRGVVGPADVGLEAVSMLAMALPMAVVGLLGTPRRKERILHGLAVCLLMAATFATVRKSAMLAPISVFLTLAYFRRRELLSLAPLGLVVALAVSMLAPGAVHTTIEQFVTPESSTATTTRDRVADYDAIRPDVWTHLLFGRGFGSYDHFTYRVLDSEVLGRLVETGVIGLAAFLLIGVAVVLAARSTIAGRAAPYAGLALIGAAAAVCFVVVSFLFDVLGYPHVTYIFLYIAGLVAVVVQPPALRRAPSLGRDHASRRHSATRKSQALRGVH